MKRKSGIVVLALAVLLALAPPTPRAQAATAGGATTAMKYIACAGSIVFMVAVPASIFYTSLVCINAFLTPND